MLLALKGNLLGNVSLLSLRIHNITIIYNNNNNNNNNNDDDDDYDDDDDIHTNHSSPFKIFTTFERLENAHFINLTFRRLGNIFYWNT